MTEKVKLYIKALATYLQIQFDRAEQPGDRPPYIFLSYKILSGEPEPAQQIIQTTEDDPDDETKVIKKTVRESDAVVSLNFIGGEKDYHTLWDFANKAYNWIDSEDAADQADVIGVGVFTAGPVQDRTVFLETSYEHKLGFDITVKHKMSSAEKVDAIDLTATIEEIQYE